MRCNHGAPQSSWGSRIRIFDSFAATRECYKSATRVLQECYRVLQSATRVRQQCYKSATGVQHGSGARGPETVRVLLDCLIHPHLCIHSHFCYRNDRPLAKRSRTAPRNHKFRVAHQVIRVFGYKLLYRAQIPTQATFFREGNQLVCSLALYAQPV